MEIVIALSARLYRSARLTAGVFFLVIGLGGCAALIPQTVALHRERPAGLADRTELDLWIQYRPTGGPLKGFRLKMQYAKNVRQQGNVRNSQPDFQFIVDYTVLFRPPPG
jgi:hypothetical protein